MGRLKSLKSEVWVKDQKMVSIRRYHGYRKARAKVAL